MSKENAAAQKAPKRTLNENFKKDGLLRVLSLDGGGAKGFYTLGVLKEIEGVVKCPLYQSFDIIFGTSTGSIIAALLALGYEADEILALYRTHLPAVMKAKKPNIKTAALKELAKQVYGDKTFSEVLTGVGIVGTKWALETPIIFKGSVEQAHGRKGTFVPGFGARIGDAVVASCSAYPFFEKQTMMLSTGEHVIVVDGGYCANNPSLYALIDAVAALKKPHSDIRLVSVGVGNYPQPKPGWKLWFAQRYLLTMELLQKTMEINSQSMDTLLRMLFKDIPLVRISDSFTQPEMATDFMEYDLFKLDMLYQRGRESFSPKEAEIRNFLVPSQGVASGNS
jgi:predicted acylesterase/phospholipase RssA